MAGVRENQGQMVFGLDIGTRSIVGTVGYMNNGKFHVLAQRAKEHETRAMLDGQIHDIVKVGETISLVKKQLEEDLNRNLTEVCIAAAGRVLRTVTTYAECSFDNDKEITEEDIFSLCTMGIEKAYEEFMGTNTDTDMKFYCVGYTPMRYYMNGYQMGNLEGHKAKKIAIDLIATFLPDDVVDGLYKAVDLGGLHVANLTLEPIAAIQVAIPEKFRMLNLALVDVGAGTSDISITKDGTITAYGMIPVAGDSLTDIIVQHCLVDFEMAEQIKRSLGTQEIVEYQDILGLPQTISSKEVMDLLEPSVNKMTRMVADCIKELNGDKPVSAVFVVGGGGMIPGYTEKLAEHLGIVKERVAIRGQEVMQTIHFEVEDARKDAMMVTPIGICLSYYEQSNNFIFVEFNKERIKLYDNGKLNVTDAAMQLQFPNEDLFPKRGKALEFTVNGKSRMVRGTLGEAAIIKVNGQEADMYTQVHNGAKITVLPSTAGEPAKMELGKLPEMAEQLHIFVNGKKISLPKTARVNGSLENEFYQIKDRDEIEITNCFTVKEVAEFLDVPLGDDIMVNDTAAQAETKLYENFTVNWDIKAAAEASRRAASKQSAKTLEDVLEEDLRTLEKASEDAAEISEEEGAAAKKSTRTRTGTTRKSSRSTNGSTTRKISKSSGAEGVDDTTAGSEASDNAAGSASTVKVTVNGMAFGNGMSGAEAVMNAEEAPTAAPKGPRPMTVLVNRLPVTMNGKAKYVYVDVFDYINFDLSASRGRSIVTTLNGRAAVYMEELKDGDVIEIYWKE